MSTDIVDHFNSQLRYGLTSRPINAYEKMVEWAQQTYATTMPPGMPVRGYRMRTEFDAQSLEVIAEVKVDWAKWAPDVIRKLHSVQVMHRSRGICLSASALRLNEIWKRLHRIALHGESLKKYGLDDDESAEVFGIVVDETLSYMRLDFEHIRHYIKDHEDSSTGQGRKWKETLSMSSSDWKNLYNLAKETLQEIRDNPFLFNNLMWHFGIRARPDDVSTIRNEYRFRITRSRIIMFNLALSIFTAFLPDKVGWYRNIINRVSSFLNVQFDAEFAFTRGGLVYDIAGQWFDEFDNFKAYDGKNWESVVPILLGDAFRPFMCYVQKHAVSPEGGDTGELDDGGSMLPSGITFTSLFGTLAMLVLCRNMTGHAIVHGDDCNTFDCRNVPDNFFLEYQAGDTDAQYILGLMYLLDPMMPRFCGFAKLTVDSAGKFIPVQLGSDWQAYYKGRDVRERSAWVGAFFGWFGDRTLIDAVKRLPADKVMSPSAMFETFILERLDEIDPFEWAAGYGLKDALTVV